MFDQFREIWLVDCEFMCLPGERPVLLCLVGREFRSGKLLRVWFDDSTGPLQCPIPTGPDVLFIAFYASAELGCYLANSWPLPLRIIDLYCEFRNLTNGLSTPCGSGLLGALAWFGLDAIEASEKHELRELAMRGGPYSPAEKLALLDYCQSDVDSLVRLLPKIGPTINLPHALNRGRYMAAIAHMEWNGVPIDVDTLRSLREHWTSIRSRLIAAVDADYGVFVPTNSAFDPSTQFGQAVADVAAEREIDPHELAEAAMMVWQQNRESEQSFLNAKRSARRATGLTSKRLHKWEDAGKDSASWPRLDENARELAGTHPELGIGFGYESGSNADTTDYSGALWELLRDDRDSVLPKHSPAILREAAEMVAGGGNARPAGLPMTFKADRWAAYLADNDIPWPRLPSGALALDDETFRQMAKRFPRQVGPIRELRHTLGQLRLNELTVGRDGRNRCLLSPYRSRTGRNQPSNSRFIFGPSAWFRSLIKPEPGRAIAYIDWSQQEFAIAAALSGDVGMMEAYSSGDPYLTFAKQAGAVPPNATKKSHPAERTQFKVCALAVQYGMGEQSLAASLAEPEIVGRELLRLHRQTYPTFWRWSQAAVDHAMLFGRIHTVFGWNLFVGPDANPRSLANFPCQANGAEMLRLACCLMVERGIRLLASIHDAVLVEGSVDEIDDVVASAQAAMCEAGRIILDGFELRTDSTVVRYPERYSDERGVEMWDRVNEILTDLNGRGSLNGVTNKPTPDEFDWCEEFVPF